VLWHVLGPLQVRTGKESIAVPAPKWRALLAALLTERDRVVATESLIDELWDAEPPSTARKLVSGYVLRLRTLLGDPAGHILVTQAPGYRLAVDRADVDSCRFEDLLADGREALGHNDAQRAADLLSEALRLWRGPALAGVPRGRLTSAETDRLEELRLIATELRIEAQIRCAPIAPLVAELRGLTTRHPLRERFWHQLMRVLRDSGRPAEALTAYAEARHVIGDELGADPGQELQQLHRQLLTTEPGRTTSTPPSAVVPRQLPSATTHFVGRADELHTLSRLAIPARHGEHAMVIAAVTGTAGAGKTGLVVHWAHQVTDRFPDGQLYVNLRGYDADQPMSRRTHWPASCAL